MPAPPSSTDDTAATVPRWALWVPVLFAVGIAVYFELPVEPPPPVAGLLALALGGALAAARLWPRGDLMFLALATILAGVLAAWLATWRVAAPVLAETGWHDIDGRVVDISRTGAGARLILDDVRLGTVPSAATPARVRVRVHRPPPGLRAGDRLRGRARLAPPPPPVMPGAFDFQRNAFFAGIGATGVMIGAPTRIAGAGAGWGTAIADLRARAAHRIADRLPGPVGGVAAALLVGQRGAIPPPVLDQIRAAGLAHLLAISGLHMGLVTGFVFFLLRAVMALLPPLALRWPIKKFAALGALAAAATYLALSGAAAPAERAFVMVTVALVAVVLDRVALSLRSLALAAVVVLALSPAALLGPSFQMSFAAAIALVALFEGPWTARLRRRGEGLSGLTAIARYGLMVAVSSLIAGLATAPFVAYHFHAVSVVGVLANLLAVPLTALWIMPAGVLALAVMPLGGDGPILDAMGWGIAAVLWWAETIAAWPRAQVTVGALGGDGLILFALGALWALLWRGRRRWGGVVAALVGLTWASAQPPPDILVSGDGRLAAVRLAGTRHAIAVSSATAGRFTRERWRLALGLKADQVAKFRSAAPAIDCDDLGCVFRGETTLVAFSETPAGQAEDCAFADILISPRFPVWRGCDSPRLVLDADDFKRAGAHAIWLSDGEIIVRNVAAGRGRRPWVGAAR